MFTPKKTKYRKCHKMPIRGGLTKGNSELRFGEYGLQVLTSGHITVKQIESARRAINKHVKNTGLTYVRLFADKPITRKPNEVKLGKGKGSVEFWAAPVKPGRIIYEIKNCTPELAKYALAKGSHKLPIKTKIVTNGS